MRSGTRRETLTKRIGITLLAVVAAVSAMQGARVAQAQDDAPPPVLPGDVGLGKLSQRVSVYLAARAQVSVTFAGDYGPVRLTGSLDEAPKEPLHLTSTAGTTRDVSWDEIRTMTNTDYPTEGFPAGSFQVALITDTPVSNSSGLSPSIGYRSGAAGSVVGGGQGVWRMLRAPEGTLKLTGAPFGTISVPTSRISAFEVVPIIGEIAELPNAPIKLEVLQGTTVSVPLSEVQLLQRNAVRGTARVTMLDGQSFSGKIVELPKVSLAITATDVVDTQGKTPPARTVNVKDIVQFEQATAGIVRRF